MEKTAAIYVKIDNEDKIKAEAILKQLGVTSSSLIQMLYKQIILTHGIPFKVSLVAKPICTGNMSKEEIMLLIQEGLNSAKEKTYTSEEVTKELEKI